MWIGCPALARAAFALAALSLPLAAAADVGAQVGDSICAGASSTSGSPLTRTTVNAGNTGTRGGERGRAIRMLRAFGSRSRSTRHFRAGLRAAHLGPGSLLAQFSEGSHSLCPAANSSCNRQSCRIRGNEINQGESYECEFTRECHEPSHSISFAAVLTIEQRDAGGTVHADARHLHCRDRHPGTCGGFADLGGRIQFRQIGTSGPDAAQARHESAATFECGRGWVCPAIHRGDQQSQ